MKFGINKAWAFWCDETKVDPKSACKHQMSVVTAFPKMT